MNDLIKNLKYAKKLHIQATKQEAEVPKQKDFVISMLKKKNPTEKDIKLAIDYVKFWRETHENWIELIKINRKWAKNGGNITWQKKWIKVYDQILTELKKSRK